MCVQISGTPDGTSLPLISFVRRLISTTSMTPKRTQVVHVNKGNDKIDFAQSTHDTAMGLMTRSKAKSTSSLSTKQTSESSCLLKPVRIHDEHQPLITLASLGAKSHSPHSKEKLPLTLRDFGDKSPCFVTNANSRLTLWIANWNAKGGKLLQSFRLFYFFLLDDYAGNDNRHYIHRGTIS